MASFTLRVAKKYRIQAEESIEFLPKNLVMLDCEMTGVIPTRDHLLQVAALKLELTDDDIPQYKEIGEPFVAYLHYQGKPNGDFQNKYLRHIFEKCQNSDMNPSKFKDQFHAWIEPFKGRVSPCGDCIPTDVAFLLEKDCIDAPDINQETGEAIEGTFHYEFFDMNSLKLLAKQKIQREKLPKPQGFDENIHDALVDCRNQLLELNQIISILL